jgi:hypothetical protein
MLNRLANSVINALSAIVIIVVVIIISALVGGASKL